MVYSFSASTEASAPVVLSLYQDPSMIEHETAASRDTYAVVDKPSEKKRGPDTVPPPSEGVSGAVLSSMHAVTIFCSVHVP